jgi:type IV secretion system protein TrbH
MRLHPFLLITALILHGCQTADGLSQSAASTEITGSAASAIAGDIAGRYAEQAGSPGAPIKMHRDTSDFAIALESALKGWGYTVIDGKNEASKQGPDKPVELAYSIIVADGHVLTRLSTDALELGRAYSVVNGVAKPDSPLALMRRN